MGIFLVYYLIRSSSEMMAEPLVWLILRARRTRVRLAQR